MEIAWTNINHLPFSNKCKKKLTYVYNIWHVYIQELYIIKYGGAFNLKGGMGMSGSQHPLFMPPSPFFRSPVAAWVSSLDPTLNKDNESWLLQEKFVKNIKNFQLYSLIFGHKLPKYSKISVPLTLLLQKNQFLDPLFGAPCRTSLPKKVQCPPANTFILIVSCKWKASGSQ